MCAFYFIVFCSCVAPARADGHEPVGHRVDAERVSGARGAARAGGRAQVPRAVRAHWQAAAHAHSQPVARSERAHRVRLHRYAGAAHPAARRAYQLARASTSPNRSAA